MTEFRIPTPEDFLPEGHTCMCGSRKDAFEAARKTMEQMIDNDCLLWAMQVASAMYGIAVKMDKRIGTEALPHVRAKMLEHVNDPAHNETYDRMQRSAMGV